MGDQYPGWHYEVFSCEICEILKNTFFIEQLWLLQLSVHIREGVIDSMYGKYVCCTRSTK